MFYSLNGKSNDENLMLPEDGSAFIFHLIILGHLHSSLFIATIVYSL